MFPVFEAAPHHAETVGSRKARKEREEGVARRGSASTSQSSGSARSVKDTANSKPAGRSAFAFFSKSKDREVQEIPVKKSKPLRSPQPPPEPEQELESSIAPSIAPSTSSPHDWETAPETLHKDAYQRQQRSYNDFSPPRSYQEAPPLSPPASTYPSPPPLGALPLPPASASGSNRSLGRIDTRTPHNDVERIRSQLSGVSLGSRSQHDGDRLRSSASHVSMSPSTASSSGRTAFSGRSVFSATESIVSEESYVDRPASNLQLEPVHVKQADSRSDSRQSDRSAKAAAQGPFARTVAKMDNAGPRIISARLSEEWEGLEDDNSYQEILFEKRLWAMSAYQRLTQNKHLQSPAHEILISSRPADQRRILHLHGSLADGWLLATRYPVATIYTTSSMTTFDSPTSYPAPLNHHSLYVPSLSSPMPFPDSYFDVIVSRSVSTTLRNDQWARFFFDCKRVLKPGGQLEVLSVDAHLNSEGRAMSSWVDEHIVSRLEGHNLSKLPSDTVLDTMEIVNLENIRRARVALPISLNAPKVRGGAPSSQDVVDSSRMMAFLGRHFYQDLYGKMMRSQQGVDWFWAHPDIQDECERHQTKMVLTIACAHKPVASPMDNFLDI